MCIFPILTQTISPSREVFSFKWWYYFMYRNCLQPVEKEVLLVNDHVSMGANRMAHTKGPEFCATPLAISRYTNNHWMICKWIKCISVTKKQNKIKKIIDHLYLYWVNTRDIPSLNMWSVSLGSWLQGNPQGWEWPIGRHSHREAEAYLHPTSNMKARSRWRSHHGLAKSNLIECKSVCAALLILFHTDLLPLTDNSSNSHPFSRWM